jgi:hypothetical protein
VVGMAEGEDEGRVGHARFGATEGFRATGGCDADA